MVFMLVVLVAMVVTVAFFVAQLLSNAATAIRVVGRALIGLFVVGGAALVGWSLLYGGSLDTTRSDLPFIAGLILPGIVVVAMQWIIVRGFQRARADNIQFGRGTS